jgi:hypothetical protein
MKIFIYKSKEALIEGIKFYKKSCKKKLTLLSVDIPSKNLVGFQDSFYEHFWALPSYLAESEGLSNTHEKMQLAEKLSTQTRKNNG